MYNQVQATIRLPDESDWNAVVPGEGRPRGIISANADNDEARSGPRNCSIKRELANLAFLQENGERV